MVCDINGVAQVREAVTPNSKILLGRPAEACDSKMSYRLPIAGRRTVNVESSSSDAAAASSGACVSTCAHTAAGPLVL